MHHSNDMLKRNNVILLAGIIIDHKVLPLIVCSHLKSKVSQFTIGSIKFSDDLR